VGSFTALAIDSFHLLSTKSYVDPIVMTLFTERDKVAKRAWVSESGEIVSTPPDSVETAGEFTQVGYAASRRIVVDRLNTMGFTLEAARSIFDDGIRDKLAELGDYEGVSEIEESYAKDIALYSKLSFESWLAAFCERSKVRDCRHGICRHIGRRP
jgi:hypothetical protein